MQEQKSEMIMTDSHTVLELLVKNHAGTMSHICGLFARRSYNLNGILYLQSVNSEINRIWLRIDANDRFYQVVKQLNKLEDVCRVKFLDASHEVFERLEDFFSE